MLKRFGWFNELFAEAAQGITNQGSTPGPGGPNPQRGLRLCYISNPNIIHTRRWVGWFARRGHTVCLLADVPPREPWLEVPVIDLSAHFSAPVIRFPVWEIWLRRFIRRWRPDVLHAHRVNSAGWLAAFSGFHPYVVTPWGSDVFIAAQRSWVARQLARYTLRHADHVTAGSQALHERAIKLSARHDCLSDIHFGVDMDIFTLKSTITLQESNLQQSLSLPAGAPIVFSPRAIQPIYNLDIIVQAIPLVRERFPDVCFLFNTYNPDPEYKISLDGLASELGVSASIRWIEPTREPAEMARRYHSSAVVISVPGSDGSPLSVVEAMACGKLVICSDLPPLREFITSGENGWLVPVRQSAPLADAIIKVLGNPIQAGEFGRKAHQLIAERANLQVEMQRMEGIYYRLAGFAEAGRHD
jgi:glycosyltransferase involved in cell wall biosynthesis